MIGRSAPACLLRYVRRLILLLALLLTSSAISAQRYPFFNIGIEQGLVQSQVFALAQDAAGHLWSGTLGGLSCYDGRSFRSFTVRDGLPSNTVSALCFDPRGLLWIGTNDGLSCYDGYTFRNYTFTGPDNPAGNRVARLSVSPDGTVWCIAGKDLYAMRAGKLSAIPVPPGMLFPTALLADQRGRLLLGGASSGALYQLTGSRWDSIPLPGRMFVQTIDEDSHRNLILLTSGGLYRGSGAGWEQLIRRAQPQDPFLYSFAEGHDGSYWISTTASVVQIHPDGQRQEYARYNGLTDVLIYDLLNDREGNIWLASNGEGLFRFSGATFTAVDERMGLTGPQVSSIAQDEAGITYFGSFDGGLYRYTEGRASAIPFPIGDKLPAVSALAMQGSTLWIGTQTNGLWKYDTKRASLQRRPDERLGGNIPSIHTTREGLWIGLNNGVALLSKDSLRVIPVRGGLVESIASLSPDSLLMVVSDGLLLYHDDSVRKFLTHSAADSAQIVCVDYSGGTVWLGTADDGIYGYSVRSGTSLHIAKAQGLRSNFIYNICSMPNGDVWAGTGYGICRISIPRTQPIVTFYGRNAGITGMESNRNAVLPLPDGSVWFGTTGGAVLYNAANAAASIQPVSLQLQSVLLFGERLTDTAWYSGVTPMYGVPLAMRLPWRQNNLSFSFSAISLSGSEALVYRYRLAGLRAPWSDWSPTNSVNFSALPPGRYTLEVQCSKDGRTPESRSLQYGFEIITPFQKTTLFRILVIAACILLGVVIQYIAARRKRARRAMIEALRREEQAKVRQRTAEDFHDEVGNKITRINVLTNVLRAKIGAAPEATRIIDQIQDNTGQLYGGTRDILWSLQPANDSMFHILQRIRDFGRDLFGDTEISFDMEGIRPDWTEHRLPMDISRNLIMIFKEALNNALKYSVADKVHIQVTAVAGDMTIILTDNGKGFDPGGVSRGQGLTNMKTRAARLGGTLSIDASPGEGTCIRLTLKIPSMKG